MLRSRQSVQVFDVCPGIFGNLICALLHFVSTYIQTNIWFHQCSHRLHIHAVDNEHTYKHPFNDPFSMTTRVSLYRKGKNNLDFTEARDSEWQWHQLGHMQVCTSFQTHNHASTPPLRFLQSGCPSCHLTKSVKALKALWVMKNAQKNNN